MIIVKRIEARARTLTTLPGRGPVIPELHWHGITRFLEVAERPWRLIYHIDGSTIHVVGVVDGRRWSSTT